jgi:glycosyltransferase involved in cell wall biosynthesis
VGELPELISVETYLGRTARALVAQSWKVHFLYHGPEEGRRALARTGRRLAQAGICFSKLGDFDLSKRYRLFQPTLDTSGTVHLSNILRHALETLDAVHHFDLIEIPSGRGVGLRTVQARRAGLAFPDTAIIVRLDGPGPRLREARKVWDSPNDVLLDYCERYTFENADVQLSPCVSRLDAARDLGWHVSALARVAPEMTAEEYADILRDARQIIPALPPGEPLVTVAVSHFNLGDYLPDTLASLAAQTYSNLEVLVIDDGSTCPQARQVLAEQERLYPHFRFLCQTNAGPGAARNRALREARGDYFIPVDADNIALPAMVEMLVRGMRNFPELSVMTCFCLAFRNTADIAREEFLFLSCPTGGPHLLSCVHNVYGDTNAIFRTADLRAVGGFETDRSTCCEDWETFVKVVNAGYRLGVIPEPLFYYRRRTDSLSGVMTREWTDFYPFVRRILKDFFGPLNRLPEAETRALWSALASYLVINDGVYSHLAPAQAGQLQQLLGNKPLRYRIADALNQFVKRIPFAQGLFKQGLLATAGLWRWLRRDRPSGTRQTTRHPPPNRSHQSPPAVVTHTSADPP